MPCYSRVTTTLNTTMQGADLVAKAAQAAGYRATVNGGVVTIFDAYNVLTLYPADNGGFQLSTRNEYYAQDVLEKVTKQYGILRVKQFAQRRGYTVTRTQQTQKVSR